MHAGGTNRIFVQLQETAAAVSSNDCYRTAPKPCMNAFPGSRKIPRLWSMQLAELSRYPAFPAIAYEYFLLPFLSSSFFPLSMVFENTPDIFLLLEYRA